MTRKRIIILSIAIVAMLSITYFATYYFQSNTSESANPLDKQQFGLYFTTNLGYSSVSKGAVLVYQGNKLLSSKPTLGMDNGTLLYSKDKLYFSDKENMYAYHTKTKKLSEKKRALETLDIATFQLQTQIIHVYNSGQKEDGKYHTTLYTKNEQLTIPGTILNAGSDDKNLYLLSDRNENNEFKMYIITYQNNKFVVKNTFPFKGSDKGQSTIIGNILVQQNRLYFVEDDGKNACHFVEVRLDTHRTKKKQLFAYKNSEEVSKKTPYTGSNSTFIYQENFYFLDKTGQLFLINLNDKKMTLTKQSLFKTEASRFIDVVDQSIYILTELKTFDKLEVFKVNNKGLLQSEAVKIIRLPQKVSEMYLSHFKIRK